MARKAQELKAFLARSTCRCTRPNGRPGRGRARGYCRQLDPDVAARSWQGNPPGLFLVATSVRRGYPAGTLASQLLGYTDIDLQRRRAAPASSTCSTRVLAGRSGKQLEVHGARRLPLETITLRKPRPGRNVQLTIDHAIQSKVQSVLGQHRAPVPRPVGHRRSC